MIVRLEEIRDNSFTSIMYESSHRIDKTLNELRLIMEENRRLCICRELTKLHESIRQIEMKDVLVGYKLMNRLMITWRVRHLKESSLLWSKGNENIMIDAILKRIPGCILFTLLRNVYLNYWRVEWINLSFKRYFHLRLRYSW